MLFRSGWAVPLGLLSLLTVGQAVTGLWAGRARYVGDPAGNA